MGEVGNKDSSAISRGCFAFKGKRKQLKLENYLDPNRTITQTGDEEVDFARGKWLRERVETLHSLLDCISRDGEAKLKNEMHAKLFAAVGDFVANQAARIKAESMDAGTIPTGAMVLGVNMPDHQLAMKTLKEKIISEISPHVVSLNSTNCGNIRTAMVELVSQLIPPESNPNSQTSSLDNTMDEDDEVGYSGNQKRRKTALCTMPVLGAWYQEMVLDKSPIVVIFEDLEGFDATVLERLVISCSGHHSQNDVSFVFLFSIATSVTAVHHLLSHSVSSLLAIQTFQAPLAVDYLSSLIDQTLLSSLFPFKLGPKIFAFLREVFHYHDFSVANFIASLQVCLMEHYFGNPISFLCCEQQDVVKRVQSLAKEDLELFRALPSFKDYLDGLDDETKNGLSKDAVFRGFLQTKMLTLHSHHSTFLSAIHVLFAIGHDLPKKPLGQRLHALYENHLKISASDCPTYAHVMQLIRMLGKEDLTAKVESLVNEIAKLENTPSCVEDLLEKIADFMLRLMDVDKPLEEENIVNSVASKSYVPDKKKGLKLHELKASLQSQMSVKTPTLSRFEKLRKEMVDCMDAFFKASIVTPRKFIFHEVVYFDRHNYLRNILNPAPRAAISNALAKPQHYLDCDCCKVGVLDKDRILATYPDVAIAYKLHLECPRFINLYDWLQAFIQVVQTSDAPVDAKAPDPVLQARFIRAVSELQFLGFIGPTSKKTDHVVRLTWGST